MGEQGDARARTPEGDDRAERRGTELTTVKRGQPPIWQASQGDELAYAGLAPDERAFVHEAAELREAIAASRIQIEESLLELQDDADYVRARVSDAFDVQRWVREHPWRVVGVAAAIGFIIGFRE